MSSYTKETKERIAVALYHANNERSLDYARVNPDYASSSVAELAHRVAYPYRAWEGEMLATRDYWRAEVDRIEAKLSEEFPVEAAAVGAVEWPV